MNLCTIGATAPTIIVGNKLDLANDKRVVSVEEGEQR